MVSEKIFKVFFHYKSNTQWELYVAHDNHGSNPISPKIYCSLMLRLHYVPGDHGSHDFGHRGRNGVTVTQRRGTGSTNVARRG